MNKEKDNSLKTGKLPKPFKKKWVEALRYAEGWKEYSEWYFRQDIKPTHYISSEQKIGMESIAGKVPFEVIAGFIQENL